MILQNNIETNKVKQSTLTRQYNIQIFNKIIFFKYRTREIKATETNKYVTYLNETQFGMDSALSCHFS